MADFSWVPEELSGRFSYIDGKLVASCEICGATKQTVGRGSVLKEIARGKTDRFRFCSIHGDFGSAKPSREDVASWPEGHKRCRRCLEIKPFSEFHRHKQCLFGYAVECKKCRKPKYAVDWTKTTFEQSMLRSAKYRANKRGLDFNLVLSDIVIPDRCPVLDVKIVRERGSLYAPSIDRNNPSKGYTRDNIVIMSWRANALKNNMTASESLMLAKYMNP